MTIWGENVNSATKVPVDAEVDIANRYALLASAISGRPLEVAGGDAGMPAWSDGRTVFIDSESAAQTQLQCVVVQASLIYAGSLEPRLLHKLARKPSAGRRYLSLEGHRALTALSDVLPTTVVSVADTLTAQRTDSPHSSLILAIGSEDIPDPPISFGVIRPRLVRLVDDDRIEGLGPTRMPPREGQAVLRELEDDIGEGAIVDILASPVGGGGPIGRLLKRLLGDARSSGTGSPGADAPTRFTRSSNRVSRMGSPTMRRLMASNDGSLDVVRGFVYPEWNVHLRSYRPEWCTVVELEPEDGDRSRIPSGNTRSLRRALARLGTEVERQRRQPQGRGS